jgi:hypothetical protein
VEEAGNRNPPPPTPPVREDRAAERREHQQRPVLPDKAWERVGPAVSHVHPKTMEAAISAVDMVPPMQAL